MGAKKLSMSFLETIESALNVYRTKNYIVAQNCGIGFSDDEQNHIISDDIFFKRTPKRDAEYESVFEDRTLIDGKRLPTTMYSRVYID